jgi:dihydrofolate reductase
MKVGLIWAQARNGVIGRDGKLPWHLPEDLAHFKKITQGHPVIMGRKTWESLPERFRPLPGRLNIVVSTMGQEEVLAIEKLGAKVVTSVADALVGCQQMSTPPALAWVIGGAKIYATTIGLADWLEVTHIEEDYAGDAFAPTIEPGVWQAQEVQSMRSATEVQLRFVRYRRIGLVDKR